MMMTSMMLPTAQQPMAFKSYATLPKFESMSYGLHTWIYATRKSKCVFGSVMNKPGVEFLLVRTLREAAVKDLEFCRTAGNNRGEVDPRGELCSRDFPSPTHALYSAPEMEMESPGG